MNINGKEWRMVPVEATPEMCKAVSDYGSTRYIYGEMLAAAPPPPVVEVTDEVAEKVYWAHRKNDYRPRFEWSVGHSMIAAVQSELGPQLGLVTREELARAVEDAYMEGRSDFTHGSGIAQIDWRNSMTRKALGVGSELPRRDSQNHAPAVRGIPPDQPTAVRNDGGSLVARPARNADECGARSIHGDGQ